MSSVIDSEKSTLNSRLFWGFYGVLLVMTLSVYRHFSTAFVWIFTLIPLFANRDLRHKILTPINHPLYRLPIIFCLIGCITALWTQHPNASFKVGVTGILTIYLFAALQHLLSRISQQNFDRLLSVTKGAIFVGLPLVLIQSALSISLRDLLGHGSTVVKTYSDLFIATLIPVACYLWVHRRQRILPLLFIAALIVNTYFSSYTVGYLALTLGAVLALPAYLAPQIIPRLYAWFAVIFTVGHTTIMHYFLKAYDPKALILEAVQNPTPLASLYHRMLHWQFSLEKIQLNPFLGHGFEAARYMPEGHKEFIDGFPYLVAHPHDFILQVWLESGMLGAAILALFLFVLFTSLTRHLSSKETTAGINKLKAHAFWSMYYVMLCLFVFGLSHSLWHKWVLTALGAGGLLLREILNRDTKNTL